MESPASYNKRPLATCFADFIGKEIPVQSDKYPQIIYEPLTKLYNYTGERRLRPAKSVEIFVYSSGIIVKDRRLNTLECFPIQNLYCSAGLMPKKDRTGLKFKHLNETKSKKRPLFAMVVREAVGGEDNSRRLLMCHGFLVKDITSAQRLVDATKYAYKNKEGWNHPMNDRQFLNARINFTLDKVSNNNEDGIVDLEKITSERDTKLQDQLKVMSLQNGAVAKSAPAQRGSSVVTTPRSEVMTPRSILSPRQSSGLPTDRKSLRIADANYKSLQLGQHQMGNGNVITGYSRPSSVTAFSLSRASIQTPRQFNHYSHQYYRGARRQRSMPATPKAHRILASSEPHELGNGQTEGKQNGGSYTICNWDQMSDVSGPETTYKKHSAMNGDNQKEMKRGRSSIKRPAASGYSIIETNGVSNGFWSAHTDADQEL